MVTIAWRGELGNVAQIPNPDPLPLGLALEQLLLTLGLIPALGQMLAALRLNLTLGTCAGGPVAVDTRGGTQLEYVVARIASVHLP